LLVNGVVFNHSGTNSPLPHFSTGLQNYGKCREFQHSIVQFISLHGVESDNVLEANPATFE